MEELAQSPDFGIELLGGQNYLGVLSEVAANIDRRHLEHNVLHVLGVVGALGGHQPGAAPEEALGAGEAKANFEMSITERYPWLVGGGVEWP